VEIDFHEPATVKTRHWYEIFVKFQRLNTCCLDYRIQWSHCLYCPTLITNRK
jgi:hypothetical protein